jgi:hypothetical protein
MAIRVARFCSSKCIDRVHTWMGIQHGPHERGAGPGVNLMKEFRDKNLNQVL